MCTAHLPLRPQYPPNKAETKISVGYIPIADCSQLYVAIEKGFFTDEGLNIEPKEFQGGPQILEALKDGKYG